MAKDGPSVRASARAEQNNSWMKTPLHVWTFTSVVSVAVAAMTALLQHHLVLQLASVFLSVMAIGFVFQHDRLVSRRRRLMATAVAQAVAAERDVRIREVLFTAADAYAEIGLDGRVLSWNTKAVALFALESEDILGKPISKLVVPERLEEALVVFEEFLEADDRYTGRRFEFEMISRTQGELVIETTLWLNDGDGTPYVSMFMRNMTPRRRAEEHVQRALDEERAAVLRLQELDRVQTDFVSSISHELRTPLTSTLGYLELLAEGDAGAMTSEQSRMIEIAARNAQRLQRLIEDVLMLSRIESGDFRVRFKPVEVHEVVREAVRRSSLTATERHVTIEADTGAFATCLGDAEQLTKALDNVIGNAVKFTPPSGSVRIEVERGLEHVTIRVTDTGIGISDEERPHLFTRFFRSAEVVQQAYHGTGLGLTITKSILEHHGGSIQVMSKPREGTTVSVKLPALPASTHDPVVLVD